MIFVVWFFVFVYHICISRNQHDNRKYYQTRWERKKYLFAGRLSKDGKWRSFPKAPRLLQYFSSGTYYARLHTGGKVIRESLGTTVWTTAQMKLVDF
jgi:hypothetical protein